MVAIFAIIKRLFASNKVGFIVTTVVVLCATTSGDSKIALSNGNYTWLLAVMTPFFFVFYDYTKLVHLGTSKKDYFLGSLAGYGLVALMASLVNTGIHILIDPLNHTQMVINMMDLCGWTANGVLVAIICIFTPIAPLRHILAEFFKVIMFNSNALLHMGGCLLLSAMLSLIGLTILKRKTL